MLKFERKRKKRITRHKRIRTKVSGTKDRPRLSVFRSNEHLHLQLIDDEAGRTLFSASTLEVKDKATKQEKAKKAGKMLSDKALAAGIKSVVFDRGGFQYHGRVRAAAEAVREAGIKI